MASDRYTFCSQLARQAGLKAHEAFGTSATSLKGRHDVVTAMDREVERFIRAEITKRYPADAVFGEEEGGGRGERLWLIDPIDGTANYARGIPRYCVSIGYVERGAPLLGAIHDPSMDWLYAAERGGGAWLNDTRIAVSSRDDLHQSTVECGWSTRRPTDAYVDLLARVMHAGAAIRRAGSGALGLADVAAGRVEAYCELHINAWDVAAGIVIVEEAGGRTNHFFGGDGMTAGNPIIATNAALAVTLADVIEIPLSKA